MRPRNIEELPAELREKVADCLSLKDAKNWSFCSRESFANLDAVFFARRQDWDVCIIRVTLQAIRCYLKENKNHPGFKIPLSARANEVMYGVAAQFSAFMMTPSLVPLNDPVVWRQAREESQVAYDKGFHRAHCLWDIIANENIVMPLRLFAVYAFLQERNGAQLKAQIAKVLPLVFSEKLTRFVEAHFGDALKLMKEALLKKVHDGSYNHYAASNGYQLGCNDFWRTFLVQLEQDTGCLSSVINTP